MTQTKDKIVEATECLERGYTGDGKGPTHELLQTLKHSEERFKALAHILEGALARQLSAAAVVELRLSETTA